MSDLTGSWERILDAKGRVCLPCEVVARYGAAWRLVRGPLGSLWLFPASRPLTAFLGDLAATERHYWQAGTWGLTAAEHGRRLALPILAREHAQLRPGAPLIITAHADGFLALESKPAYLATERAAERRIIAALLRGGRGT